MPPGRKSRPAPMDSSLPLPESREMGNTTGWALWDEAMRKSQHQFADTAPMTAPFPPEGGDRRYARTEPSALPAKEAEKPAAARAARATTIDEVMLEARKANRVCPKPVWWEEMYARMPEWGIAGAQLPRPPLSGDSWDRTPALAKRMSFRDHVEWCEQQRCLKPLLDYLKALPDDAWHRMGD